LLDRAVATLGSPKPKIAKGYHALSVVESLIRYLHPGWVLTATTIERSHA
jgi:hypothetical protein